MKKRFELLKWDAKILLTNLKINALYAKVHLATNMAVYDQLMYEIKLLRNVISDYEGMKEYVKNN